MPKIICSNYDCLYCDKYSYQCSKDIVCVGDEYECGCEDYISYLDSEEYQVKFYKAVKTKDGKIAKAADKGKRIEYNGRVFYTRECVATNRLNEDESFTLTEERTGYFIGSFAHLKDRFEKFIEAESKIPDIKNYPLAIWNGKDYVLAEGADDES